MEDTAQNNGATGNHTNGRNGKRPRLMAELEAEYWIDLPLEMVEHGCAPRVSEECWRVAFGIVRCSLFFAIGSKFAVRPRFRRGGFKAWVEAFHARAFQKKPLKARDLDEEMPDTDDDGNPVPLTFRDLAAMLAMSENNVRRGWKEAIRRGLVLKEERLYPNPKPSFLPKDPDEYSDQSIFWVARTKLRSEYLPADSKLRSRCVDWVNSLQSEYLEAEAKLRSEIQKRLLEGAHEYSLLIPKRGRVKSKESVRPSLPVMQEKRSEAAATDGRSELLSMTEQSLLELRSAYPHYGFIDNPRAAANAICEASDWKQGIVVEVFQTVVASLKKGKSVESIPGLLVSRARRYQQDRAAAVGA